MCPAIVAPQKDVPCSDSTEPQERLFSPGAKFDVEPEEGYSSAPRQHRLYH